MGEAKSVELSFAVVSNEDFPKCRWASQHIDCSQSPLKLPKRILGDRMRLQQVLINLIKNALEFTSKGKVRIVVAYDWARSRLLVAVQDTGRGIASEKIIGFNQMFG